MLQRRFHVYRDLTTDECFAYPLVYDVINNKTGAKRDIPRDIALRAWSSDFDSQHGKCASCRCEISVKACTFSRVVYQLGSQLDNVVAMCRACKSRQFNRMPMSFQEWEGLLSNRRWRRLRHQRWITFTTICLFIAGLRGFNVACFSLYIIDRLHDYLYN